MAVVYVDDKPVDIGDEKLNVVQAALKGGVFIPHYCWHPALSVVASCRMCLVEVGERKPDGSNVIPPKVVPACQTPAKHNMVVVTASERAKHAMAQTLESLLINHPLDCPVCDKAGECLLQDFSYGFGRSESRLVDAKNTPPNKPHLSDTITLFTDRCIMCSRCVRFTREISGMAELQVIHRGHHAEIDIFPGQPLNNKLAGNVVDLCPVGALGSKDFLYKQRVWFLKSKPSVCGDCSTGCSIWVDQNKDIVFRLRARSNPKAQGDFMCDEGRHGFHYVSSSERFTQPLSGGKPAAYEVVVAKLRQDLQAAALAAPASVVAVLSPFLTCEEAYLWAKFFKGLHADVRLALGHVPVVGEDDTYPKDRKGNPAQPVKFTIRAEKCPNRRGVEAVLQHFQGSVIGFESVLADARQGKIKALFIAGGYPPRPGGWIDASGAEALKGIGLLVVQDLFRSPASDVAKLVLPAATFAEKDGTFVNHNGLAQSLHWATRPPGSHKTDGQLALDLLERRGLFHADTIRTELAKEVPAFAALAAGKLGEHGIELT